MVKIIIHDMMGKVVSTLVDAHQSAGYWSLQWDATSDNGNPVSAGLYIYKIEVDEFSHSRKMVLLK